MSTEPSVGGAVANLPHPGPFAIHDANIAESWRKWKSRFNRYLVATGLTKLSNEVQVSTLLTVIGAEAHDVFSTFTWTEGVTEETATLSQVLEKFDMYCNPRTNITFERFKFNSRHQQNGETLDQYVTELRKLASQCNFDSVTPSEILHDRIVFGIADNKVRERLLRESTLTLDRTLEICRAAEVSVAQLKEVQKLHESRVVSAVSKKPRWKEQNGRANAATVTDCRFCGQDHERIKEKCPAWGKECSLCHRKNHFRAKCLQSREKSVRTLGAAELSSEDDETTNTTGVYTVRRLAAVGSKLDKSQTITLKVRENQDVFIRFQIDTGADVNVIPEHVYKPATGDTKLRNVQKSSTKLQVYSCTPVEVLGRVNLHVWRGGRTCVLPCEIVRGIGFHSILGKTACEKMDILKILDSDLLNPLQQQEEKHIYSLKPDTNKPLQALDIIERYPEVFSDRIGLMNGEYSIKLDDSVRPVQHAPRTVPVALRKKVKAELDSMEAAGVITTVSEPSEWISSMVVVPKKDGKIRLCIDPRDLNRAVQREHYPFPTVEEIATRLDGAKVFTVLDMHKGFWHIKIDEKSSKLTTFNTPFGRYKYQRLPFGISSAPEVFQKRNHLFIEGLSGVEVIADDFIVYGKGDSYEEAVLDHDKNLLSFLDRCKENNVVLSQKKMQLRKSEVPFIGHVATDKGLQASPDKIKAIRCMPEPNDVAGVRRFLGMTQYLAKFQPALSDMTAPLRALTKQNVEFSWQNEQQSAFDSV